MGIVNKRNAIVGWLTLGIGKRIARKKARGVSETVTGAATGRGGKIGAGVLGALAALGGFLLFWRRRRKHATE